MYIYLHNASSLLPQGHTKCIMTLCKFDEFMHCFQHGHDANEAHDNFNITQELKNVFCNFNGMKVIIHFNNQSLILHKNPLCKKQHNNPPYFSIAKHFLPQVLSNNYANLHCSQLGASWVKRKNACMWCAKDL